MKRHIFALLFTLLFAFSLVGCDSQRSEQTPAPEMPANTVPPPVNEGFALDRIDEMNASDEINISEYAKEYRQWLIDEINTYYKKIESSKLIDSAAELDSFKVNAVFMPDDLINKEASGGYDLLVYYTYQLDDRQPTIVMAQYNCGETIMYLIKHQAEKFSGFEDFVNMMYGYRGEITFDSYGLHNYSEASADRIQKRIAGSYVSFTPDMIAEVVGN